MAENSDYEKSPPSLMNVHWPARRSGIYKQQPHDADERGKAAADLRPSPGFLVETHKRLTEAAEKVISAAF